MLKDNVSREANKQMQLIDLKSQYQTIKEKIDKRIKAVLEHSQYIMGPEVPELEEKLANYVGVKHCVSVASGTDALVVSMLALGIGRDDEVITTPLTFAASAEAIAFIGARPVFVDIDPKTYNIDPNKIEKAITAKTKAILPVNIYGQCADFDAINAIAEKRGLAVIEDAAQSFGATYKGKKSCSLSTIGCTSFFPAKPLGGYGDGGACFTNDTSLAKLMREIRIHGQDKRYHHARIGMNSRLDSIQAAVLLVKLEIFPDEVKKRQEIGARYSQLLKDTVVTPYVAPENTHVYGQYTIQVKQRESLQQALQAQGIPTAVQYPIPLNLQPAFAFVNQGKGSLPIAEELANSVLSLPMHPYLELEQQQRIVFQINETLKNS